MLAKCILILCVCAVCENGSNHAVAGFSTRIMYVVCVCLPQYTLPICLVGVRHARIRGVSTWLQGRGRAPGEWVGGWVGGVHDT